MKILSVIFLNNQNVIFFGDGALKCRDVITHKNAIFADEFQYFCLSYAETCNSSI